MSELVTNCPRCDAKSITFDVRDIHHVATNYQWQRWHEAFCICRSCKRCTIFVISQKEIEPKTLYASSREILDHRGDIGRFFTVERYVSLKDEASVMPPDHVPDEIKAAFIEGATCLAVECWNAAAVMFRACIDLATRPMLPTENIEGLNEFKRRNLGPRLTWLLDNGKLPEDLRDLSTCIKEDGNDGAHQVNLEKEDAEDILDFTLALLERLYTEPERLKLAQGRRENRRKPK
jgi:hypothetical protein